MVTQTQSKLWNLVSSAHQKLVERYGAQRTSTWEPAADNVFILSDEEFKRKFLELNEYSEKDSNEQRLLERNVGGLTGYSHFPTEELLIKQSAANGNVLTLQQTIAHEELHIWCKRDKIDQQNKHSYGVNETFIDYLSLVALELLDTPLPELPNELHNHVANALHIHEILDALGNNGDKLLFDVCQGKDQNNLKIALNRYYHLAPNTSLNERIPSMFGRDFYGRFKEFTLFLYVVGLHHEVQFSPPGRAFGQLITEWLTERKEIKYVNRPDLIVS